MEKGVFSLNVISVHAVFYLFFILFLIAFSVSVFLFFYLDIPEVVRNLRRYGFIREKGESHEEEEDM